jgi:hypothetical protein
LKFDSQKLARIGWAYNIESHIQTKLEEPDGPDSPDGSIELRSRHKQDEDIRNKDSDPNIPQKLSNRSQKHVDTTTRIEHKQPISSQELSELSVNDTAEQQIPNTIYRIAHTDRWACRNCNVKGDKWFMLTHPEYCRGGAH